MGLHSYFGCRSSGWVARRVEYQLDGEKFSGYRKERVTLLVRCPTVTPFAVPELV
jgi:hypothetical protein